MVCFRDTICSSSLYLFFFLSGLWWYSYPKFMVHLREFSHARQCTYSRAWGTCGTLETRWTRRTLDVNDTNPKIITQMSKSLMCQLVTCNQLTLTVTTEFKTTVIVLLLLLLMDLNVCRRQETHLFSLVTFASFLTRLSNLSLGKRNTHMVNQLRSA